MLVLAVAGVQFTAGTTPGNAFQLLHEWCTRAGVGTQQTDPPATAVGGQAAAGGSPGVTAGAIPSGSGALHASGANASRRSGSQVQYERRYTRERSGGLRYTSGANVLTLTGDITHVTLDSFVKTMEEEAAAEEEKLQAAAAAQGLPHAGQHQQQEALHQQHGHMLVVGPLGGMHARGAEPDLCTLPEEGPSVDLPALQPQADMGAAPHQASSHGVVDSRLLEACLPETEDDL